MMKYIAVFLMGMAAGGYLVRYVAETYAHAVIQQIGPVDH